MLRLLAIGGAVLFTLVCLIAVSAWIVASYVYGDRD